MITYSIVDGNNDAVFRIDASSGEIFTTNVSPDFEVYSSYILIVLAVDNGMSPRQASTAVFITIMDVNDNSPIFGLFSLLLEVMHFAKCPILHIAHNI